MSKILGGEKHIVVPIINKGDIAERCYFAISPFWNDFNIDGCHIPKLERNIC